MNPPEKDKALFWSGPKGTSYKGPSEVKAKSKGLQTLQDLWKTPAYPGSAPRNRKFWEKASGIMADNTSGKAHVLLPKTGEPDKKSVWTKIERPALEKNPKVSSIVRLNPEDHHEQVIHQASGAFVFFNFCLSFRPE